MKKHILFTFILFSSFLCNAQQYLVSTFSGSGNLAFSDGVGTSASFANPRGIAMDTLGNLYIGDALNHRIRKISPAGIVTTLAGSGVNSYADGNGTSASFNYPDGIAVDASGFIYVADTYNNRIRKISPAGVVTTLAGSGDTSYADGTGTAASFASPTGVAVDQSGYIYVSDALNHRIRKISPSGLVTTLAGSGIDTFADGIGTAASFKYPRGVAVDSTGNVYVADGTNYRIRKISPSGVVITLAGSGTYGNTDGIATEASFKSPYKVAVDVSGNVYVADANDNKIRKISISGNVTTIAGSGNQAYVDGIGITASFYYPSGLVTDNLGNLYLADKNNNRIRKLSPIMTPNSSKVKNQFLIYPNPANNQFMIELNKPSTIHVYNSLGQLILSQYVDESGIVNTSKLPSGIYNVLLQGCGSANLVISR